MAYFIGKFIPGKWNADVLFFFLLFGQQQTLQTRRIYLEHKNSHDNFNDVVMNISDRYFFVFIFSTSSFNFWVEARSCLIFWVTPSRRRKKENRCDTRANENKPKRTHIFLLKERRYIFINIISSHIFLKEKNLLFGVDGARLVQPNKTILDRFFRLRHFAGHFLSHVRRWSIAMGILTVGGDE